MGRGFRGGGGRGRGRGRGRGGGGGGGRRGTGPKLTRKDVRHLEMFGEQHPSKELESGPSVPFSGKKRSGGRDAWKGQGKARRMGEEGEARGMKRRDDGSEEESEEELTPYKELLSIFKKKSGKGKDQVQIVSDEEEDEDEEEEQGTDGDEESGDEEESEEEDGESVAVGPTPVMEESKRRGKKNEEEENIEEPTEEADEEPVIEEAEISPEMDDHAENATDPFLLHFERDIPELVVSKVKEEKALKLKCTFGWPEIERFQYFGIYAEEINEDVRKERNLLKTSINLDEVGRLHPLLLPSHPPKTFTGKSSLDKLGIKKQLQPTFAVVNQNVLDGQKSCQNSLSRLQQELLELAANYYDGYFPIRCIENEEAIRNVYCLHVANHILKTRTRILHHNAKMTDRTDVPEAYRDQGFVRPKVLILAPFKDTAYKIVKSLISILLPEEKGNVANKKRFIEDYSGTTLFLPKTNPKPDDYMTTFAGNVEDTFKLGMSLTKKTIKLYTGFYSSDIIIASPLGLRMIVGAEGERDRDYDFLSSIEVLIMDQADIFLMQNWDHLLHIMRHMNLQPVTTHGTDFARIRPWVLDGLTKYFRQTLVFSSVFCPEHSSLFTKYCQNFAGQVRLQRIFTQGAIISVTAQIPQVFQYYEASSLQKADDERFDFFIKSVLPSFSEKLMSHTLIFVSSYFDFVRLRNHFKREQKSFVQICEYTKDKKVARSRDYFYHGKGHFLLYTERVHFFRRFRLKGIGHILFYQLPQYPHFYSELCNFIQEDFQNRRVRTRQNASVNVIYSKYDSPRLAAVVGTERATQMLSSDKNVHAFVSGKL